MTRFSRILPALCIVSMSWSPAAEAQNCQGRLATQAPLDDNDGFINMPVMIGGRPVTMLVDTGSDAGLFTALGAARLGLHRDGSRQTVMQGTGGVGRTVPNVRYLDLVIGALRLGGGSMPAGGLPGMPIVTPPVVGLLGADVLSRFDVEFDLPRHRISFWSIPSDAATCAFPNGWGGSFDTIPLTRQGSRLTFTAILDGQPISVLVDTGARSRILSRQAAIRLGVDPEMLDGDPGGITAGVDLHEASYHWHRFSRLVIGSETQRHPVLTVAPLDEPVDLLLGADWFADRDVLISYATNRMFVRHDR
ncbi:aspartyl protease family protein [Lichenicola sp.]|uniref:aspartyl protease family protein n=1 Tax=Lichenicola sp. TaxID=2804529 RepID=UPI003B00EA00